MHQGYFFENSPALSKIIKRDMSVYFRLSLSNRRDNLKKILKTCFLQNAENATLKIEKYFEIWNGL